MKQCKLLALGALFAASALASQIASAAQTANLSVGGTILPNSCSLDMSNGGVQHVGDISSFALNMDTGTAITDLPATVFTIICSGPTFLGFTGIDNRRDSDAELQGGLNANYRQGLGFDSAGNKIGNHFPKTNQTREKVFVDGVAGILLKRETNNPGGAWSDGPVGFSNARQEIFTFSFNGSTTPVAFTQASFEQIPYLIIRPKNQIDTTQPINIDGSTTIELVYL